MESVCSGILILFLSGCCALFLSGRKKGISLAIGFGLAQFFLLPQSFYVLLSGKVLESSLQFSEPIGCVSLRLDALSALFLIIIAVGSLLTSVYSIGYLRNYKGSENNISTYYFFLGFLAASMASVVIVQNAVFFLFVWELMSLSSFFLVSFDHQRDETRKTAVYYLVAMQVSAAFLFLAFGLVSSITNSFDFSSFGEVFQNNSSHGVIAGVLFFLGFGVKAGFFPMHTWLPRAHPTAPSGVSALMSGVMIKTGIYGILRVISLGGMQSKVFAYGIITIGLLTALYGIANASVQKDFKRILAFSSIENIGIIGIALGVGLLGLTYNNSIVTLLGFAGVLLHTFNHFTFKSLLFYSVGIVYQETHTRNIEYCGGLVKQLPRTAILSFLGFVAISGMPPLSGFVGEFLIYLGIIKSISIENFALSITAVVALIGMTLTGAIALLTFTKTFGIVFLGSPRVQSEQRISEEHHRLELLVTLVLAVPIVVLGIVPFFFIPLLTQMIVIVHPALDEVALQYFNYSVKYISIAAIIFMVIVLGAVLLRRVLLLKKSVRSFKTWDCGYQGGSSRLQYSGSSFIQLFQTLLSPVVPQKKIVVQEESIFPSSMRFESHTYDFFERHLLQPIMQLINTLLDKFSWIQSGKLQQYILYGLLFLISVLIWIWCSL